VSAVPCGFCGHDFKTDPVYAVPCPSCPAPVGKKCKRPSGHDVTHEHGRGWHIERDMAAARAGAYHHTCNRPCPKSCGVCHPDHLPLAPAAAPAPTPGGAVDELAGLLQLDLLPI